jgi:Fe-Mn family superoxide dismutase
MKGIGFATMALGMEGLFHTAAATGTESPSAASASRECILPPLPYPYDALEPHIDKQTLTIHHDRHHAGYVKKFNSALRKLVEARDAGDFSLIKHWSKELAFHGSGHVLHSLYWGNMSPQTAEPSGGFMAAINRSFGGFKQFQEQFMAASNSVEGSGWGVLAHEPYRGYLLVLQAEKHQDLGLWGVHPLLVCDVWEHAYYLTYQNRRDEYIKNFMKIINWKEVERRYDLVKGLKGYR